MTIGLLTPHPVILSSLHFVKPMTIILLEPVHADAHALLQNYGTVVLLADPTDVATIQQTPAVEALITRGRGQIRRELMAALPDLRVVARCGVGLDNIDTLAANELGITVVYAPGSTTTAVAEHTLMLMLALARGLVRLDGAVKAGNWAVRNGYSGIELAGKTLGIIGMGDIGQRVAQLAAAFGMKVIYWNRRSVAADGEAVEFDQLLARADVISLHLALTPETRHIINRQALEQMKLGALLINSARGSLVDQTALHEAIVSGKIGGYASDVLEAEPPAVGDVLVASAQTVITPHIAALTDATYRLISVSTCENVVAFLQHGNPDPKSIYRPL